MMWGYADGGNWLWMVAMMIAFYVGVIALALAVIRAFSRPRGDDQAMDLLRRRLAGGEISHDDFEKTRKTLQG